MKRVLARVVVVVAVCAAVAGPAAYGGEKVPLSPLASVEVVGSGPLAWRSVAVRSAPRRSARVITTFTQFREHYRPRVVLALEARTDQSGVPTWYRVEIPGRPNGRSGWIPAAAAELSRVDRWLVVYRGSRKFELYVNGRLRRTGPVAIGARGMETPLGLFYVVAKFRPSAPILGAFAFETSAYSKLSDWPGGGIVGIHGTNSPSLLGQAVSHGCVRVANEAILRLKQLVAPGTPIRIVA